MPERRRRAGRVTRLLHTFPPEHPIYWRPGNSAFAPRQAGPVTAQTAGKRAEWTGPAHKRASFDETKEAVGPRLPALLQRARVPFSRHRSVPPVDRDPRHLTLALHAEANGKSMHCHRTTIEQVMHGTASIIEKAATALRGLLQVLPPTQRERQRYPGGRLLRAQGGAQPGAKEVSRTALQQRRDYHGAGSEQESGGSVPRAPTTHRD